MLIYALQKLYAVCDLALGLLQKNLTNIVLKDENVDPVLPCKLFTKPEKVSIRYIWNFIHYKQLRVFCLTYSPVEFRCF